MLSKHGTKMLLLLNIYFSSLIHKYLRRKKTTSRQYYPSKVLAITTYLKVLKQNYCAECLPQFQIHSFAHNIVKHVKQLLPDK